MEYFTNLDQILFSSDSKDPTEDTETPSIPWDTIDTKLAFMGTGVDYSYPTAGDEGYPATVSRLLANEDIDGSSFLRYSFSEPFAEEASNSILSGDYSTSPAISGKGSHDLSWNTEPRPPPPSHCIWQWYDEATKSWYWRILPTFSEVSDDMRLKENIVCKNYTSGSTSLCKGECLSDWISEDAYDGTTSYMHVCRIPGCSFRLPTEQVQYMHLHAAQHMEMYDSAMAVRAVKEHESKTQTSGSQRTSKEPGSPKVQKTAASHLCPFPGCKRSELGFGRRDNLNNHIRLVHRKMIEKQKGGRPISDKYKVKSQ